MRHYVSLRILIGLLVSGVCVAPSLAQDREPSGGYSAIIDNIDLLVDNYARFLARKYNLSEEQNEYTKHLLRERSYEFLDKHEDRLRVLVDRLFEVRGGGDMNPDELVQWGHEIQPIYDEAKRIIVEGNDSWREILNEDQRRIHDEDLRLMTDSFATTEDQLTRIQHGEMTVDEFRNPRAGKIRNKTQTNTVRPRRAVAEPPVDEVAQRHFEQGGTESVQRMPRPAPEPGVTEPVEIPPPPGENGEADAEPLTRGTPPMPPREPVDRPNPVRTSGGQPVAGQPGAGAEPPPIEPPNRRTTRGTPAKPAAGFEGEWDKYVADFIARYSLDEEQQQKANAMLENCKSQASRYLRGKQNQMTQLDTQLEEAKKSTDKDKAATMAAIQKKRSDLEAPISQIFEKSLKPKLESLPSRAQRKAAEQAAAEKKSPRATRKPR